MGYVLLEFGRNDLRQSYDSDIAEAARRMVAGEKDVWLVILDNKEYYLAFAPMREVGWSFGMLLEKNEVMAPARKISDETSAEMNSFQ